MVAVPQRRTAVVTLWGELRRCVQRVTRPTPLPHVTRRAADNKLNARQGDGRRYRRLHCSMQPSSGAAEEQIAALPVLQRAGALRGAVLGPCLLVTPPTAPPSIKPCVLIACLLLCVAIFQVGASLKVFDLITSDSSFVTTVRNNTHHFRRCVNLRVISEWAGLPTQAATLDLQLSLTACACVPECRRMSAAGFELKGAMYATHLPLHASLRLACRTPPHVERCHTCVWLCAGTIQSRR